MEMNHKQPIKYSAITLGMILATAFVLVQPTMQNTYAQVSAEGAPNYFVDQLADPLEMNTVRVKDVAKTVIIEKEIFRCDTVQGLIDVLVDVTVIGEIFENMTTKEIISKRAEVIACVKLAPVNQINTPPSSGDGTLLGCDFYTPSTDFVPVTNCVAFGGRLIPTLSPDHMQEANTVNKGSTVKTIIAQKELLYCNFGTGPSFSTTIHADIDDKKVEQYTIEEIWENTNLLPGDTIVQRNVESLRCWTLVTEAFVESCQFTTVPVQPYDDEDETEPIPQGPPP
jgi:hypothetical protein